MIFFFVSVLNEQTDHLIADEFSAELAEGVAYVSGHDEESRPVLVIPCFIFFLFFCSLKDINFAKFLVFLDFPVQTRLPKVAFPENVSTQKTLNQIFPIFSFSW